MYKLDLYTPKFRMHNLHTLCTYRNVVKFLKNSLAKKCNMKACNFLTVQIVILKYHNQISLIIHVKFLTAQLEN